jgi:hypothetical protein
MGKRHAIKIEEVQPHLYAVLWPANETTPITIGYVLYSIMAERWWLYTAKSNKIEGHEYEHRATAVRALAKLIGCY